MKPFKLVEFDSAIAVQAGYVYRMARGDSFVAYGRYEMQLFGDFHVEGVPIRDFVRCDFVRPVAVACAGDVGACWIQACPAPPDEELEFVPLPELANEVDPLEAQFEAWAVKLGLIDPARLEAEPSSPLDLVEEEFDFEDPIDEGIVDLEELAEDEELPAVEDPPPEPRPVPNEPPEVVEELEEAPGADDSPES